MTSFGRPSINYGSSAAIANDTQALFPLYASTIPNDNLIAAVRSPFLFILCFFGMPRANFGFYYTIYGADLQATGKLIRYLGWKNVLFIASGELGKQTLVERVYGNVKTIASRAFHSSDSDAGIMDKLRELRQTGVRNIVAWIDDPALFKRVLRQSIDVGLAGTGEGVHHNHTWIIPSFDIADSVRFNNDMHYEPRLQLSLKGMLFIYPHFNITIPDLAPVFFPSPVFFFSFLMAMFFLFKVFSSLVSMC